MNLNSKECKILAELFEDSRQSYVQLGKRNAISKESVAKIISNLQERGIITGFSSILDTYSLGKRTFRILFSGNLTYDLEKLDEIGEIAWVAELAGNKWSLTIAYYCQNTNQFYMLMDEIFKYIKGITRYEIIEVLGVEFFFPQYIKKITKTYTAGKVNNKYLTENETQVIHQLIKNARSSILDIANQIQVSHTATTYIIKKLFKEKILIGSIPNIDYQKLGFDHYKLFIYMQNPSQRILLKEVIKQHPGLIYITHVLANHAVECEIISQNLRDVTQAITEWKRKVDITEYQIILTNKVLIHNEGL